MRFAVLGPVRAWRATEELDLRPRQLRLMLALLLVRAGRPVAVADFVALLWDEDPPARAVNIVHRHIGALRRILEPGLAPRAPGRWVDGRGGDYRLHVDAESSDVMRFRARADAARQAARAGDRDAARAHYLAALRTWHGHCAAGLDPAPALLPEFVALDHERSATACAAADVALAGGRVTELVPLLRPIADRHPFDEALQARLLLVLAADGKQAEAVTAFEKVRLGLSGQLGVTPGAELRAAYDQVLRQQQATAGPATPQEPVPRTPPAQVPLSTRFFSGREREIGWLSDVLSAACQAPAGPVMVAVDGLPGIGKTSLVVHWAHTVAESFPDGRLFIDLQGYDAKEAVDTEQALTYFLSALAGPRAEIPATVEAQAALYRTLTAGRRMLVILDNARDAEQVRPLLPTAPGCFVVVTSRNPLTGLVVHQGAHRLALELPTLDESRAGLRTRLGAGRDADDPAALDEIIEGCGRLPLAIAVVAARAAAYPDWRLGEIARELRDARSLDVFDGDDPRSDVRSVFSWSYRMLTGPAARLFRLLALHPGPSFGPATAAALAGVPLREAQALIEELTRTRLLIRHQARRYVFHDLIHLYAVELGEQVDGAAERQAALARLLDHLRQTAYVAGCLLMPQLHSRPPDPRDGVTPEPITGIAEAMTWFATERAVLEAVVAENPVADFPAWRIVESMLPFYQRSGMFRALEIVAASALRTARSCHDREGLAHMHRMIAGAKVLQGRGSSAINHFERALAIFDELGKPFERAFVLCNLAYAWLTHGSTANALRYYELAWEFFAREGDRPGQAMTLFGMGDSFTRAGDAQEAVERLHRASGIFTEIDDPNGVGVCAMMIGKALEDMGRLDEAIEWRHRARRRLGEARNEWDVANNERALGDLYLRAGRPLEAIRAWQEARRIYVELGSGGWLLSPIDELLSAARAGGGSSGSSRASFASTSAVCGSGSRRSISSADRLV
ncbi:AfsR/SARP family transcriptional regulator [Micromonospora arida]|uniref:NB-ARC domain-containing protein n=1 Tax=Micromonospora zamorensis TaxID=709883 RepID=A0ABZ1PHU9_9ACTN